MGWNNPPIPWSELERRLSGKPRPAYDDGSHSGLGGEEYLGREPDSSPGWSRKRAPYQSPTRRRTSTVPYAELHAHSNFSWLDGASHPEEMAETAAALGLEALALTDHDGFYGVVRFAEAAKQVELPTIFGAELSFGLTKPQNGVADPEGNHLVILARDPDGYRRLATAISNAQRLGEKGKPVFDLDQVAAAANDHFVVLTGCRKGAVPRALSHSREAARRELDRLTALFGRDNVAVELTDHGLPQDAERIDALAELTAEARVDAVATTAAHYAVPSRGRLASSLAAVRARRGLDDMDGWLPAAGSAYLRSGEEMVARFARHKQAVRRAAEIGRECAFDLALVAPKLPDYPVPPGHSEMSWLAELTWEGAARRYGPRGAERIPGAYRQLEHELAVIEKLGFPGYFLVVYDIVQFCMKEGILCQGRGSAANSAVCFAIGITNVDAVKHKLLFERFLAPERDGPPDIDIDIAADRREEVIQHVYDKYGRDKAAQVANVITYRPRSAVRDMAKALGFSPGQQDAWSKRIEGWGGIDDADGIPPHVVALAQELEGFPRHLGIHSGGMVICDRPVVEVCPVEWGRMENRSVLQWDKDDCASEGLVKFDLLGLGMLGALDVMIQLVRKHYGVEIDLAELSQKGDDTSTYDMICAADTVGVFQIESRAQMATLPRLRPRKFYDLVVEVALIRPGPIQGGSVHPYIRRLNKREEITYPHDLAKPALKKTLGVPLFQEQMMQLAIDVAGCSADEADMIRRAMGSKRSEEKMEALRQRLYDGMARNGVTGAVADDIFDKLAAFANFGFAESHAISFAFLVYTSCWLKRYYPAAFYAALLNCQPMGFYSPQSLVADARRHGLVVRGPDINISKAKAILEPGVTKPAGGLTPLGRNNIEPVVRMGLSSVRHLGDDVAERIEEGQPYTDMADLVRRSGITTPQVEALATAGAFDGFQLDRRQALWAAGAVATERPDRLPGGVTQPPLLPLMSLLEQSMADLWSTGVTADSYPTQHIRAELDGLGVTTAAGLRDQADGTRVLAGGVVTHRQRPATASGTTFLNLEDETGMVNVVCSRGAWRRFRRIAREASALLIRGRLEHSDGVVNLVAEHIAPMPLSAPKQSRDFH